MIDESDLKYFLVRKINAFKQQKARKYRKKELNSIRRVARGVLEAKTNGELVRCWMCQRPLKLWQATVDHLKPISKFKTEKLDEANQESNLDWACRDCNNKKGDKEIYSFSGKETIT